MSDDPTARITVPGGAADIRVELTDDQRRALQGQMTGATLTCQRCKRQHGIQLTLLGGDVDLTCPCGAVHRYTISGELKRKEPPESR